MIIQKKDVPKKAHPLTKVVDSSDEVDQAVPHRGIHISTIKGYTSTLPFEMKEVYCKFSLKKVSILS
jgi:hypothetical protein